MITIKSKTKFTFLLLAAIVGSACGRHEDSAHYDKDWKEFTPPSNDDAAPSKRSQSMVNGLVADDANIDANRVVFKASFNGQILADKVKFLYTYPTGDISQLKPEDALFYRAIKDDLDYLTKQPIKLVASQTYGDSEKSIFTQRIESPTDAKDAKSTLFSTKGDSASGEQVYHRITSNGYCPPFVVCINKIISKPDRGSPATYCFVDANGKPTAIPIGASPGTTKEDIAELSNRFGPYVVKRYQFDDFDCKDASFKTKDETEIEIVIKVEEDPADLQEVMSFADGDHIDYGISFSVMKMKSGQRIPDDREPYIDSLTGMQARTVYYFNAADKSLVRIKKDLRKSVTLPYGLNMSGYHGVLAQIQFRFCKDLLMENSKNFCSDDNTDQK